MLELCWHFRQASPPSPEIALTSLLFVRDLQTHGVFFFGCSFFLIIPF